MNTVLIIGAGASGLMAASELVSRKNSVIVIEARDRVGGRIHTLVDAGFSSPVEAGAEFVHGKQPITLTLAKKSKSEAVKISGNHFQVFNGDVEEGSFMEDEWDLLAKKLKTLKIDTDISTFLDEHFPAGEYYSLRKRVKGYAEGFDVADIHKVSAFALREEWGDMDEGHQYHIRGGYTSLMEHLAEKVRAGGGTIDLSTAVHEIEWSPGKVKVFTQDGRVYTAEKVVITVPIGVLQNKSIRFSPAVPTYEDAISKLGFGGVIKFLVEFEKDFWDDISELPFHNLSMVVTDATIPTWWTQRPDNVPVMTGWLGGPPSNQISHDPEMLKNAAIHSLHKIFKYSIDDVSRAIKKVHIADWVRDPYALGGYSYKTVASEEGISLLSKGISDTIYFAGEGIAAGTSMGTVEAALQSGKDIAGRCIKH